MAHIPQDLIDEILPQLPVKSLKRFRCLSKFLCELIDSPQFIDSHHLSKSSLRKQLIFRDERRKKFHLCDVNFDLEDEILPLGKPVSFPLKKVYGHCKGLLLLYRGKLKFVIWNPSIHQYRNLPDCPLEGLADKQIYKIIGSGLSYDVLEGSLCISYLSIVPLQADLFIKDKDGATWIQLFSVTEPLFKDKIWFKCLKILGYSKGGAKVVLDIGLDFLVSYDLREKSFAKVQIDKDRNWKCPIPYLESLVSVGGGA